MDTIKRDGRWTDAVTVVDRMARGPMADLVYGNTEVIELSDAEVDMLEALASATPRALRALAAVCLPVVR